MCRIGRLFQQGVLVAQKPVERIKVDLLRRHHFLQQMGLGFKHLATHRKFHRLQLERVVRGTSVSHRLEQCAPILGGNLGSQRIELTADALARSFDAVGLFLDDGTVRNNDDVAQCDGDQIDIGLDGIDGGNPGDALVDHLAEQRVDGSHLPLRDASQQCRQQPEHAEPEDESGGDFHVVELHGPNSPKSFTAIWSAPLPKTKKARVPPSL